ncbi:MAG: serine/threonine protein kinase [Labilithrix sp.]|nr:serine/threonine protein kinase [Labilithrix sp.]
MKLEVGLVLSGTLRLVRKIADGGMGSVWIAEHLILGREVAVKFMSGPWALMPSARARFLREARMTAQIDSARVVRVLDCRFDEGDEPYLVLELLRGENLEQRVRAHGALSVYEAVEIMSQACEALAATHDAGIVHRDLKPENIFLLRGPRPSVKLLDYGVAKPKRQQDCVDVDRLPAGTPQYMSPEHMFDPENTDERSDLFSLAAVLYFALTRHGPFDAESLEGLYFAIDGGAFRRPSGLRPELPPALDRWFEKALAHDPKQRFADAREMARTLEEIVREASTPPATSEAERELAPISARRLGRSRSARAQSRQRGLSWLRAPAALGLVTSVVVFVCRAAMPTAIASTPQPPPVEPDEIVNGAPSSTGAREGDTEATEGAADACLEPDPQTRAVEPDALR